MSDYKMLVVIIFTENVIFATKRIDLILKISVSMRLTSPLSIFPCCEVQCESAQKTKGN